MLWVFRIVIVPFRDFPKVCRAWLWTRSCCRISGISAWISPTCRLTVARLTALAVFMPMLNRVPTACSSPQQGPQKQFGALGLVRVYSVASEALFRSMWFLAAAWRHWETLSGDWWSLFCVRARKLLLLVLQCYGFTKSWILLDGEARDPCPASGLSTSSKLKREDENEGRERFSNWCPVLNRQISARLSQSMVVVGRSLTSHHFLAVLTLSDI